MTSTATSTLPSVTEFLQAVHPRPDSGESSDTPSCSRVSLGNPAGDADSIVSAIGMAYVDTVLLEKPTLPIVSIPLDDLITQRPETKYLFQLAGIVDVEDYNRLLVGIDAPLDRFPLQASVTLVDHNQLAKPLPLQAINKDVSSSSSSMDWKVEAIWDHHFDEEAHLDTCPSGTSKQRNIAFDSSTSAALVASTCTLVVEQLLSEGPPPSLCHDASSAWIPPSLSILLLGVILLDSVNLSPKAGKATDRDRSAIQVLQKHTNWNELWKSNDFCQQQQNIWEAASSATVDEDGKSIISDTTRSPSLDQLFEALQNQKFHPDFWNGLTALQAMKLDYKSFAIPVSDIDGTFGLSSILQDMWTFLDKPSLWTSMTQEYFSVSSNPELAFHGLMFMSISPETGTPQRQLILSSPDKTLLNSLVEYLHKDGFLQAQVVLGGIQTREGGGDENKIIYSICMEQGNPKASRKQVVPVLLSYYGQAESET